MRKKFLKHKHLCFRGFFFLRLIIKLFKGVYTVVFSRNRLILLLKRKLYNIFSENQKCLMQVPNHVGVLIVVQTADLWWLFFFPSVYEFCPGLQLFTVVVLIQYISLPQPEAYIPRGSFQSHLSFPLILFSLSFDPLIALYFPKILLGTHNYLAKNPNRKLILKIQPNGPGRGGTCLQSQQLRTLRQENSKSEASFSN